MPPQAGVLLHLGKFSGDLGTHERGVPGHHHRNSTRTGLIAAVIAFPIAGWAMNKWLQDFAYRTRVSWWIFLVAALTAIVIALATVGYQSLKAALANPVSSLRSE
jgi:putative ABC transport system permease protein